MQNFSNGPSFDYLPRPAAPIVLVVLILLLATACASASGAANDPSPGPSGKLTVFAAISLSEAFAQITKRFESDNPGVSVDLNLAGSQRLRTQLEHGARGDIFAAADQMQMNLARASGIVEGEPVVFATNRLVVIVPIGESTGRIATVHDLGDRGIKLALAHPDVPAGGYARNMIAKLAAGKSPPDAQLSSKIDANVVTLEPNVRAVAAKVALGEVDAGVVYLTDVSTDYIRDRVRVITIPEGSNVVAVYPMAQLREAGNPLLAERFIRFVLSSKGQTILESHGFRTMAKP